PLVQTSSVHWLPSTGTSWSLFTTTTAPAPSHWFSLQSPAVCIDVAVPAGAKLKPHTPPVRAPVSHSASIPGPSARMLHPVHAPLPSQIRPGPHALPAGTGRFAGPPLVQTSLVHGLLSTGTSLSLFATITAPMPSHSFSLQSPGVCVGVAVPRGRLA